MKAYITGTSAITPQNTIDPESYLENWSDPDKAYYSAIEPAYKGLLDPKMSRRMSKIVKMSIASGIQAMAAANIENPDAIIVGTGLGCIGDTEKFITNIIEADEGTLSPTAFIQSTHNTIAGQLALSINCVEDNFTYVSRGHSFENALNDAILRITEGADNVLVGGADEITPKLYDIMHQMHCNKNLVLGEGACFFVLSGKKRNNAVSIADVHTCNDILPGQLQVLLMEFLKKNDLKPEQIDALLLGVPDGRSDEYYDTLHESFSDDIPVVSFKKVTGEYFTSVAYAYNLGTMILQKQRLFAESSGKKAGTLRHLLIYNHYNKVNHSLSLLSI